MPVSRVPLQERSRSGQNNMLRELRRHVNGVNNAADVDARNDRVLLPHDVEQVGPGEDAIPVRLVGNNGNVHNDLGPVARAGAVEMPIQPDPAPAPAPHPQQQHFNPGDDPNPDDEPQEANRDDIDEPSSDEEDEEVNFTFEPLEPLFQGSPATAQDTLVLVLAMMINHNLTSSCVSDMLKMIALLCPAQGKQTLSIYQFRKFFKSSKVPLKKHFYCSLCNQSLNAQNDICNGCRVSDSSYFIQLSLLPQVRELFKREGFFQSLQERFVHHGRGHNVVEDIYDGNVYKEYVANGFLAEPNNISLTWYTDGIPLYNNKKNHSIWPFYYMINELPYRKRVSRENILLGGLWFGPGHPNANLFMTSFVPDLRKLFQGVRVRPPGVAEGIVLRCVVIAGVCDTPAKSSFQNFTAHNGYHGCPRCEIRGENLQILGETRKFVYRFQNNLQPRTMARCEQFARQAINSPLPVCGVKGPTALRLFMYDYVRGVALDPMHLIFGVTKKLLKLHFSSKCGRQPYSLREVQRVVDEVLLRIKPPGWIHRKPSSIEHYGVWKSSELRSWLFYYSLPIYKELLPARYFNHYLKFVTAVSYLSSNSIPAAIIDVSKTLLHEFVRDFEVLYGLQYCSINVHLLLHVADCVRDLGPLWVYTCFPMENINGLLVHTVHGKTNVDSQVCNGFWQVLSLFHKIQAAPEGPISEFLSKRQRSVIIGERIGNSCYVVGLGNSLEFHNLLLVQRALQTANIEVEPRKLTLYFRLLKDSVIFISETYTRNKGSNSAFVAYNADNETKVGAIFIFVKVKDCQCGVECACEGRHFAIIRKAERAETFSLLGHEAYPLKHIHRYHMTREVVPVPVTNLKHVCVFVSAYNNIYIAQPINIMEKE